MKILKIGFVLTAVSMLVFACAQNGSINTNTANNSVAVSNVNTNAQTATPPDELANARKIYSTTCIKCHKEDGKGGITDIEGTKVKAPDFTSDKLKNEPDAEFIEIIQNGEKGDGMPAFKGKISDEEIKNLVKLIRRDFQGKQ